MNWTHLSPSCFGWKIQPTNQQDICFRLNLGNSKAVFPGQLCSRFLAESSVLLSAKWNYSQNIHFRIIGFPPSDERNFPGIFQSFGKNLFHFWLVAGISLFLTVFPWCAGTREQHHSLSERWYLEWLLPCLPGDARPVLSSRPAQQQPQAAVPWRLCHRYDRFMRRSGCRDTIFQKLRSFIWATIMCH